MDTTSNNIIKNNENLLAAARITVVFLLLYATTFVNILVTKKRLLHQALCSRVPFDRYTSPEMHSADRLQGNLLLEWSPIFLGLLWSLAATTTNQLSYDKNNNNTKNSI